MAYSAEIITDSISNNDHRLTTFEVTTPRIVLAEFNTHRMFSRNSASSRAIPVEKQLAKVLNDPFIPVYWGKNQAGMQSEATLTEPEAAVAETEWLISRDYAVLGAVALMGGINSLKDDVLKNRISELKESTGFIGVDSPVPVHKQLTNRLLEAFMWQTIIVTATDWNNFYALRANPDAQPEIQKTAYMMKELYENNLPKLLDNDEWHLPYVREEEKNLPIDILKKCLSVGAHV